MLCQNCKRELREGTRFCVYCGMPIPEPGPAVQVNQQELSPEAQQYEPKPEQPEKPKKKKKPLLVALVIVLAVLVVLAAVAVGVYLYMQSHKTQDLEDALQLYVEALDEDDEDKLFTAMFPKDRKEDVEEAVGISELYRYMAKNYKLADTTVSGETEVSSDLEKEIEKQLDSHQLELTYEELKQETLGDGTELIAYRQEENWYILPGMLDAVETARMEADKESAADILAAIESALAQSDVAADMESYTGAILLLEDDWNYLPQSFRDAFTASLPKLPQLQHTSDGATGFSFRIDPDTGAVQVYIASGDRMDEWEILPDLTDRYETGKKEQSDTAQIQDSDYSYAKLISEDSPILGYWQAEDASMYIGWNTSPDEEGLSVYVFGDDLFLDIINRLQFYSWTGSTGEISFDGAYGTADVQVTDKDHITLTAHRQATEFVNTKDVNYEFTRSALDDSLADRLCGQWDGIYYCDYSAEISYDGGYHFKEYFEDELDRQCLDEGTSEEGASIVMYDGNDSLLFLTPCYSGDYEYGMYYNTKLFIMDSDNPDHLMFASGGVDEVAHEGYDIYRAGSESADIQEAIRGYRKYLSENDIDYDYCELIYLDDDNIPELAIDCYYADHVLAWHDGTVQECSTDWGNSALSYREKTGEFCLAGINGSFVHCDYYKYENGVFKLLGNHEYTFMGENNQEEYRIDGELVTEQEYDDYEDSYGDYDGHMTHEYTLIDDAYFAFEQSGF